MFYLHLLTGLISSTKYWRVAKNLLPVLKVSSHEETETLTNGNSGKRKVGFSDIMKN